MFLVFVQAVSIGCHFLLSTLTAFLRTHFAVTLAYGAYSIASAIIVYVALNHAESLAMRFAHTLIWLAVTIVFIHHVLTG